MNRIKKLFGIRTFSPLGFLSWAGLIAAVFLTLHAAGWREHTTFISGTDANGSTSATRGMVYLISYFAFMLATPILVLAAGIFAGLSVLIKRSSESNKP